MKFYNYALIGVGLSIMFELAGMSIAGSLLTYMGINVTEGFNFQSGTFWVLVLATLGAATVIGIGIGTLTKSSPENFILIPVVIVLATTLIVPLVGIELYARTNFLGTWVHVLTMFISAMLVVGFAISTVEFFRGTD